MWLYDILHEYIHWSASLYKKFLKLVPWYTLAVVIFTLISQFTMMLASITPLKVIILIGSDGIPSYFPEILLVYGKNLLVASLSLAAICFYAIHLLAEKCIDFNTGRGASEVLRKSRKIVLFSNQDLLAKMAYHRLSRSLALIFFASIVIITIAIIYPFFATVLVGYILIVFLFISVAGRFNQQFRYVLEKKSVNIVPYLTGGGFLLLFSFMVADFILWQGGGIIYAIICLLLVRQLFQRINAAAKDAALLTSKKEKINTLFFHGHVLHNREDDKNNFKLWSTLEHPCFEEIITTKIIDIIDDYSLINPVVTKFYWRQTGIVNVVAFDAIIEDESNVHDSLKVIIKIFDHKYDWYAVNEKDILTTVTQGALPAGDFIGGIELLGFQAHVFSIPAGAKAQTQNIISCIPKVLNHCWGVSPPKTLVDRYRRTHPLLPQRLSTCLVHRLQFIARNQSQISFAKEFARYFNSILEILIKLPLCIANHEINKDSLLKLESGGFLLLNWSRWVIEPIGVGFPIDDESFEQLEDIVVLSGQSHKELLDVKIEQVKLCAYMYEFEMLFKAQRYGDIFTLLPKIIDMFKRINYT